MTGQCFHNTGYVTMSDITVKGARYVGRTPACCHPAFGWDNILFLKPNVKPKGCIEYTKRYLPPRQIVSMKQQTSNSSSLSACVRTIGYLTLTFSKNMCKCLCLCMLTHSHAQKHTHTRAHIRTCSTVAHTHIHTWVVELTLPLSDSRG